MIWYFGRWEFRRRRPGWGPWEEGAFVGFWGFEGFEDLDLGFLGLVEFEGGMYWFGWEGERGCGRMASQIMEVESGVEGVVEG